MPFVEMLFWSLCLCPVPSCCLSLSLFLSLSLCSFPLMRAASPHSAPPLSWHHHGLLSCVAKDEKMLRPTSDLHSKWLVWGHQGPGSALSLLRGCPSLSLLCLPPSTLCEDSSASRWEEHALSYRDSSAATSQRAELQGSLLSPVPDKRGSHAWGSSERQCSGTWPFCGEAGGHSLTLSFQGVPSKG